MMHAVCYKRKIQGGILLSGIKSDLIYSLPERNHTSTSNIHLCSVDRGQWTAQSWKMGLGIQNLGLEGLVYPPPPPNAHKSHLCSQNLEVWRRRRIKSPSEGPWFHLWGPMVKIIIVCSLNKIAYSAKDPHATPHGVFCT